MNLPALAPVAVLSPRVVRVLGRNPGSFTLQGTNTYLVGTGPKRVLIDAGEADNADYVDGLFGYLDLVGAQLGKIVITHWHPDHVGGVEGIVQRCANDKRQVPTVHKYLTARDDGDDYSPLVDKQEIQVDPETTLVAHHTPGHADDHLVFYLVQENIVFSGDNVLGHGSSVFNHLAQYLKSLQHMKTIPQHRPFRIFPGHGQVISNGEAKLDEYIGHRVERERQVLQILNGHELKPVAIDRIVDAIYNTELAPSVRSAATRGIQLHLDKLVQEGVVASEAEGYVFKECRHLL